MDYDMLSLKWDHHLPVFKKAIGNLRREAVYTDASLWCCGKLYPVHRIVMATCSEYFLEIFSKVTVKDPIIVLNDITSKYLEHILDYFYIGKIIIQSNDLESLMRTAELLKVKGLVPDVDSVFKSSTDSKTVIVDGCNSNKRLELPAAYKEDSTIFCDNFNETHIKYEHSAKDVVSLPSRICKLQSFSDSAEGDISSSYDSKPFCNSFHGANESLRGTESVKQEEPVKSLNTMQKDVDIQGAEIMKFTISNKSQDMGICDYDPKIYVARPTDVDFTIASIDESVNEHSISEMIIIDNAYEIIKNQEHIPKKEISIDSTENADINEVYGIPSVFSNADQEVDVESAMFGLDLTVAMPPSDNSVGSYFPASNCTMECSNDLSFSETIFAPEDMKKEYFSDRGNENELKIKKFAWEDLRKKKFKCRYCSYSNTKNYLKRHEIIHEKLILKCEIKTCAFSTFFKSNMAKHAKNHNNNQETNVRKMCVCPFCPFVSTNKFALAVHTKRHLERNDMLGKYPGNSSTEPLKSNEKTTEISEHSEYREGSSMLSKKELERKLKKFKKLKNETESAFFNEYNLTSLDTDKIESPKPKELGRKSSRKGGFQCKYCSFCSNMFTHVKKHQLIHNTNILQCGFCAFSSFHKSKLEKHTLKHNSSNELVSVSKMYKCKFCPFVSTFQNNLFSHEVCHRRGAK